MGTTIEVAIIGTLFTFFAAFLTALVNFYRERSERQKWQRTLALEERRIKHEENKWALDLNNQREMEIHKMRLRTYPDIFAALGQMTSYNFHLLNDDLLLELAEKFNQWGYGEAGLCMLPDTRDAVFILRNSLVKLIKNEVSGDYVRVGSRTDLVELMRRDLNHDWSLSRNLKPLIDINRDRMRQSLEGTALQTTPKSLDRSFPIKRALHLDSINPIPLHGEDVEAVQQRLSELGYIRVGEADGYFRRTTEAAVKDFQGNNGLDVDGVIGPVTWKKLFSDDALPKP